MTLLPLLETEQPTSPYDQDARSPITSTPPASSMPEQVAPAGARHVEPVLVNVSTPSELAAALKAAEAGTTIALSPGDYGSLSLRNLAYQDFITIRAVSPGTATFNRIDTNNSSFIRFDGIKIEHPLSPDEPTWTRIFAVRNGSNHIEIINCEFLGDDDGHFTYDDPYGIQVDRSHNIDIRGNSFHDLQRGVIVSFSDDVEISQNRFNNIQVDGINFEQVRNLSITDNTMSAFHAKASDHGDFIQGWTDNSTLSSQDVTISGNIFYQGNPDTEVHGILLQDNAGGRLPFRDVTISNNVIITGHQHGIRIQGAERLQILNNTVISAPGARFDAQIEIHTNGSRYVHDDIIIRNNVTNSISAPAGGAVAVGDNVLVTWRDQEAAGYYGTVFVDGFGDDGLPDFLPIPGGAIDLNSGFGAADALARLGLPIAYIEAEAPRATLESLNVTFSAAPYAPNGLDESLDYVWDFGDGGRATGAKVTHAYAQGGSYDVSLRGTDPSGVTVFEVDRTLRVESPLRLSIDFERSLAEATGPLGAASWARSESLVEGPYGMAADFRQQTANYISVKGAGSGLTPTDELSIYFDFCLHGRSKSVPIWLHDAFGIVFADGGRIDFYLKTDQGFSRRIMAPAAAVGDGQWHGLKATYDASTGVAALFFDGVLVGEQRGLSGRIPNTARDLTIGGDPWGSGFDGQIDNIRIIHGIVPPLDEDRILEQLKGTDRETTDATDGPSPPPVGDTAGNETLSGTARDDLIAGGGGDDALYGLDGSDRIDAGDGADSVYAGTGNDTVYGGGGNDALTSQGGDDLVFGGAGNDLIAGLAGRDTLCGDEGNDTLFGGPNADLLSGGSGNDALNGGDGNDTLAGGSGNDTFTGGFGADAFIVQPGSGHDLVRDFRPGSDRLILEGFDLGSWSAISGLMTSHPQGTQLAVSPDASVTLVGVSLADLGDGDVAIAPLSLDPLL